GLGVADELDEAGRGPLLDEVAGQGDALGVVEGPVPALGVVHDHELLDGEDPAAVERLVEVGGAEALLGGGRGGGGQSLRGPTGAQRGTWRSGKSSARTMWVTSWGRIAWTSLGWSARRLTRRAVTRPAIRPEVEKPGESSGWPVRWLKTRAVG